MGTGVTPRRIDTRSIKSGDEGIRTPDPLLARQVLSQLSYTPKYMYIIYDDYIVGNIFN